MKFPWSSSKKLSKKNTEQIDKNERKKTSKTYQISSLPNELKKIAILIQYAEKEVTYLKNKLAVTSKAKKELEEQLKKGIKEIDK